MKARSSKSSLRIIGGNCRGRKITFPDIDNIRPTSSRIRETLFNWISPSLPRAHCLELFAGSGILSIEALSRGAQTVTIIDECAEIIDHIRQQMLLLELTATSASLHQEDALNWLTENAEGIGNPFDIVFMDPPFATNLLEQSCQLLSQGAMLSNQALVYIESDICFSEITLPSTWSLHRHKKAGNVHYGLCKTA